MRIQIRKDRRRGVAMVEFALSLTFLIPLLLGTFVFGFRLIRSIEMSQITRDIGHMYIRGINFRNPGPQANAQTLSSGFDLSNTGKSLIILSKIKVIQQADCDAANAVVGIGAGQPCANLNKPVFMEQLTMGNSSVSYSVFGTPTPIQGDYTVTVKDMGRSTTTQTSNFSTILTLKSGEYAYVCEMFNQTPELNVPGLSGQPQVYARTIF
jgi:Flp pilus assembly protein TadG